MTAPTRPNPDPRPPAPEAEAEKPLSRRGRAEHGGKVVGTLLLIGVITGIILVCFAANYIRTVIIRRPTWRPTS